MTKKCKVAIVGVTGAVGHAMLAGLQDRKFPIETLYPLASEQSAGKTGSTDRL